MPILKGRLLTPWRYAEVARRHWKRNTKRPMTYLREELYQRFWNEAARRAGADIVAVGDNYFQISKDGRSTLVQFHYVNIDTYFNMMVVGQKPLIHKMLNENGYTVPRYLEYDLRSLDQAWQFLRGLNGRAVVKPCGASGGAGITTGIDDYRRLRRASIVASAAHSRKRMMIEEELPGDSYRLLFLDGDLIDAIKRSRPSVIGDGRRTIRELIADENRQRRASGPSRSLIPLNIDLDCKYYLRDQGLSLSSVPNAGERTYVKNVSNENSSRDNATVRHEVHPDLLAMGRHVRALLGTKLIGIDYMASDISAPLSGGGGFNEINIPPGLHYHELIANEPDKAQVGARILEFILSNRELEMSLLPRADPAIVESLPR